MTSFFVALVVAFSGFINSLTGFGFIIVAAPFLIQILPPKKATSVALILGIILCAAVGLRERRKIAIKVTLQMFAAALFGIPIGTAILVGVNPSAIKIIVGSIVIGVTFALARGMRLPPLQAGSLSLLAGFLSGILSGISGMSGAITVIFLMSQRWSPDQVRPTIATFNSIVGIVTLLWLLLTGTIGRTECIFAITFLPVALLGIVGSGFLYTKLQTQHFRPLTFLLVMIAGIVAVITGILELMALC
jgi:uncharacterized protein